MAAIKSAEKQSGKNNIIPIFFATDDNYVPYLAVALRSLIDNASKDFEYRIYILNTKLTKQNYDRLANFSGGQFKIEFVNVTKKLDRIGSKLHLRDYYSKATYYRFFICSLFPQYDKALYLDCDIVVLGDISVLYNHDLGDNYAGAVQEEVMATIKVFGDYVEQTLDVPCPQYFNAGIMLMNLKQFRQQNIEGKFVDLLSRFKFSVTQDQDYLNVLCKDKMTYFDLSWNKTPIEGVAFDEDKLNLIHYKINWKPWHYDNVLYGDYFWQYAMQTEYFEDILKIKRTYSDEEKKRDIEAYEKLVALAIAEMRNENSYKRAMDRIRESEKALEYNPEKNLGRQREFFNGTVAAQIAGFEKN